MGRFRRTAATLLLAVGLSAAAAATLVGVPGYTQEDDQSTLARLLSRVLSTPATTVRIGRVEGALSSNSTIHDIRISDADGEWLILRQAKLSWSRTALLSRRLQINELAVDGLSVLRRPLPAEEVPEDADQPILPELPVKVVVARFALNGFQLGEPILGTAARLSATGSAEIGDPKEGLKLTLDGQREDAPGHFAVGLGYAPGTETLDLSVDLDEPAGGLVAHAADIPGLPPVSFKIAGSGPLDGWTSRLDFVAGPDIGADGRAVLDRDGPIRRLRLDLAARISGLVPAPLAPVVRNTTQMTGSVVFGDDGGYAVEDFGITSEVARLGVSGYVTARRDLDLTLQARALPTDGTRTRAGQAEIGNLALDARVEGPLALPRINGTLAASDIRVPEGALASVDGRISMVPVEGTKRFALDTDLKVRGLAPDDRDLARALGDRIDLSARGVLDEDRVLNLEAGRLDFARATATLDGLFGASMIDANAGLQAADIAPYSGLVGRTVAGSARLTARLTGNPQRVIDAAIDGRLADLRTGTPAVDGLLGREVSAAGVLRRVRGGFELDGLRLNGAHLSAVANGRATQQNADVVLTAEITDLGRADARVTGKAGLDARLTGSLRAPEVKASLAMRDATALGRPIKALMLGVDATDLAALSKARVTLDGDVGGKPARGVLELARIQAGGWDVDTLDLGIGSVTAQGALRLASDNTAVGRLTIRAANLDDISPIVLTRLAGSLDADVTLEAPDGRQNASILATGERLAFAGNLLRRVHADARVSDLYREPRAEGVIEADGISASGQNIDTLRLTATGDAGSSLLDVTARARGFDLAGKGRLVPGTPSRLDLASFTARRGKRQIALAGPARIALTADGAEIADLVLRVDGGRVAASGRVGRSLDLSAIIERLPLTAAEIAVPGLGLTGTLGGRIDVRGPAAAPTGSYNLTINALTAPQTREAGLPPLAIKADGRFADGRAGVNSTVNAGRAGTITVSGSVPMAARGGLDLAVRGTLDAALANTQLSAEGQRVTGSAKLDLRVAGTFSDPRIDGTAALDNGSFADPTRGVSLQSIRARLAARGDVITVESLSAVTPANGRISGSGRVTVDPVAGFPGDLRIIGQRAQLIQNDVVTATADLDLQIAGPLARTPRVSGRIGIIAMDVAVPDRLPGTLQPLPETRHVGAMGAARQRLATKARRQQAAAAGAPFNAVLDLVVSAPNRIFVRGRGLNAELGGDLRLTGTSSDVIALGAFELRRGRFDVLGQRIDLTRGRLGFAGSLTPDLDFLAQTTAGDVTAQIAVTGSASEPDFVFSSNPDLPQDEVLSRLLFGKASGGLSAGQALQLAQAVAQFSGGGSSAFEDLRRSLGVDSLDITTGEGGGVAVGASRYINDRVSLGVQAGAKPEDAGVTLNLDVSRHLKVKGKAGADGSASGGISIEREY
jgi:translocation and assembly module TamB